MNITEEQLNDLKRLINHLDRHDKYSALRAVLSILNIPYDWISENQIVVQMTKETVLAGEFPKMKYTTCKHCNKRLFEGTIIYTQNNWFIYCSKDCFLSDNDVTHRALMDIDCEYGDDSK